MSNVAKVTTTNGRVLMVKVEEVTPRRVRMTEVSTGEEHILRHWQIEDVQYLQEVDENSDIEDFKANQLFGGIRI